MEHDITVFDPEIFFETISHFQNLEKENGIRCTKPTKYKNLQICKFASIADPKAMSIMFQEIWKEILKETFGTLDIVAGKWAGSVLIKQYDWIDELFDQLEGETIEIIGKQYRISDIIFCVDPERYTLAAKDALSGTFEEYLDKLIKDKEITINNIKFELIDKPTEEDIENVEYREVEGIDTPN